MTYILDMLGKERLIPDGRKVKIIQAMKMRDGKIVLLWGVKPHPRHLQRYEIGQANFEDDDGVQANGFFFSVKGTSIRGLYSEDELTEVQDTLQLET